MIKEIDNLKLEDNLKDLIIKNITDELISLSSSNTVNYQVKQQQQKIETIAQFLKSMRGNPIFNFAELDEYKEPTQRYIILHTPRSGSTVICDELFQLDLFGKPEEYLNYHYDIPKTISNFPSVNLGRFLEYILRYTQSNNGVAGFKCDYHSLYIAQQACDSVIPYLKKFRVIRLFRQDKVSQAISLFKAQHENLFHSHGDIKQTDIVVDEAKLHEILEVHCDLVFQETMLSCFLRDNKIASTSLSYEFFLKEKFKFYEAFGDYVNVEIPMKRVSSLTSNFTVLRNKNSEVIKDKYLNYLNQRGLLD